MVCDCLQLHDRLCASRKVTERLIYSLGQMQPIRISLTVGGNAVSGHLLPMCMLVCRCICVSLGGPDDAERPHAQIRLQLHIGEGTELQLQQMFTSTNYHPPPHGVGTSLLQASVSSS